MYALLHQRRECTPAQHALLADRFARCARFAAANVNILPRRGVWGNRVPHTPTRWEGLGGRSPPRKYVHPVGVRRSRMDG
jgi:hypothetical protein